MPSADSFEGLRSMLLNTDPAVLHLAPTNALPRVWAGLMEMGYPEATVTLVAVADGATSLYFSSGGGIIGGGEHDAVSQAALAFLETIDRNLDGLEPSEESPLPERGRVRFNVLGYDSRWTAEAAEDDLGEGRHPLSTVFHAGQTVITQLRLIEQRR